LTSGKPLISGATPAPTKYKKRKERPYGHRFIMSTTRKPEERKDVI